MTSPYGSQNPGDENNWNSQFGNPSGEQNYGQPYGQPFHQGYGAYNTPISSDTPQPSIQEVQWRPFDLGVVFGQAWKGFVATWQAWVLATLVFYAITFLLMLVWFIPMFGVIAASTADSEAAIMASLGGMSIVGFIVMALMFVISFVWTLNCYRNAARVVRGEQINVQSFFKFQGLGKALGIYILVAIVTMIGTLLLVIPGIVAAVVLVFAVPAAFQLRDVTVGDAFSASWKAVSKNIGVTILLLLAAFALNFLGGAIVIGVLVTTPLTYLLYAYAFQNSIGGPIMQRQ
ncbi:hypothetical protein N24_2592 [Corynebacterium suranareeae]|uniref:Integral membrane protein n=1 Tax=Corynebacterium suranareeae TaxID=2506452 RepID=A0A160PSW5_9CORY|nr:hypothetical protein [Corynebacterium suranareeae]BAU96854.1 hypothetical protein N24_2592 [Corynebacterium suranareeae]